MNNPEYNFPEVSTEILKSIQHAKQANLLDRSYHKIHTSLNKEILENSSIDHDLIIRQQLRERLVQQLFATTEQHIKVENYRDANVYSLELCVFPLEDLKHIVEFCVKEMSMEELLKIKNND